MTVWRLIDPRHVEKRVVFRLSLEPPDRAIESLIEDAVRRHGIELERVGPNDPPQDPVAWLP